ncbi:hypothetical protein NIES3974_19550 [Calothrix sp. NIES-3974]|nr:hypothetical protein NIES3974_19550 [Calothrix sp. NIES-3974]
MAVRLVRQVLLTAIAKQNEHSAKFLYVANVESMSTLFAMLANREATRMPRTTCTQNVKYAIHHFPHINFTFFPGLRLGSAEIMDFIKSHSASETSVGSGFRLMAPSKNATCLLSRVNVLGNNCGVLYFFYKHPIRELSND